MAEQILCRPYCMVGDQSANVAATGMVHLRTVRPRGDSQRFRFQVFLSQLRKSKASGMIFQVVFMISGSGEIGR
jgi:hypothetical protein